MVNVKLLCGGGHNTSVEIAQILKIQYNIDAECFIDNDKAKIDNCRVYPKEYFAGKSHEYYIVVPIGYYKSVSDSLKIMGYTPVQDYYYFCDCIVRSERDYYEDRHGNMIRGVYGGIKIAFCSYNVHIEIGEDTVVKNCNFSVASNAYIKVGDNASISDCSIEVRENANLIIGNNANLSLGGKLAVQSYAQIAIGEGSSFAHHIDIRAHHYSKIFVGKDCMFSYQIIVLAGDGHSIFDINSGEKHNSPKEKLENIEINIGDHVWIGARSTILSDTEIGNGSIVGAASLVKGSFPNNCILAGNPARILRKDIAWCREDNAESILQCGLENINLTREKDF